MRQLPSPSLPAQAQSMHWQNLHIKKLKLTLQCSAVTSSCPAVTESHILICNVTDSCLHHKCSFSFPLTGPFYLGRGNQTKNISWLQVFVWLLYIKFARLRRRRRRIVSLAEVCSLWKVSSLLVSHPPVPRTAALLSAPAVFCPVSVAQPQHF